VKFDEKKDLGTSKVKVNQNALPNVLKQYTNLKKTRTNDNPTIEGLCNTRPALPEVKTKSQSIINFNTIILFRSQCMDNF